LPIDAIGFDKDCTFKGSFEFRIPNEVKSVRWLTRDDDGVHKVKFSSLPTNIKQLQIAHAHNCVVNKALMPSFC
jgi:hypothetical protein